MRLKAGPHSKTSSGGGSPDPEFGAKKKGGPRLGTALDVRAVRTLWALPALTPTLATNRGLALAFPLGARLLVVATLTKLRIEARALHFPLEAAQSAVEALVVLYDDFQDDHILW